MIVFQNDHAGAATDGQKLGRGGNAIADRGDQGDVGGIGIEQPCRGKPRAFVLFAGEPRSQRPGFSLAPDGDPAGFLGAKRQRAVGGGIQVADLTRDIEQGTLRRKHFDSLLRPVLPDSASVQNAV